MRKKDTYQFIIILLLCFLQAAGIAMYGQDRPRAASKRTHRQQTDTLNTVRRPLRQQADNPTLEIKPAEPQAPSASTDSLAVAADSLQKAVNPNRWIPNPTKATWLALVIPGGGQIYNRKYWKLPIFYGGFAGCAYALSWNNRMYKDYSAAYKDAASGNWNSTSITDLLPPGYKYSESQLMETLRKRKDTYRRYRDLSIFAFIGVYLLSVVDAYVDAELSNFDISPDLSMRVEPAVISNRMTGASRNSVGVQCSLRF